MASVVIILYIPQLYKHIHVPVLYTSDFDFLFCFVLGEFFFLAEVGLELKLELARHALYHVNI
jgi:hypothetical protein